jgi:hypothetical protein
LRTSTRASPPTRASSSWRSCSRMRWTSTTGTGRSTGC